MNWLVEYFNIDTDSLDYQFGQFVDNANAWLLSHQLLVASQLIVSLFQNRRVFRHRPCGTGSLQTNALHPSSIFPLPPNLTPSSQVLSIAFFYFVDAQPTPTKRAVPKLIDLNKAMADSQLPAVEVPVLNAPLDTPYTVEELKKYDGKTEGEKIFVAIKGVIFDGESVVGGLNELLKGRRADCS